MAARVALLSLLAAVGVALARLPVDAPRSPEPRLPEPRTATDAELDAVEVAVRAAGAWLDRRQELVFGIFPGRTPHRIGLGVPLTAERIDRLPDPDFAYDLSVSIDPKTPPGLLARLGRLRHLRRVKLLVHDYPLDDPFPKSALPPPDAAARVAELAAVPHLERLRLFHIVSPLPGSFGDGHFGEHGFGDDVAAVLPAFPALRRVTDLTRITDRGAAALARADRLEAVEVGGPGLTAAGMTRLATLPRLRELTMLGREPLTADALRPFADHPRLTTLSLWNGVVGMDAVEELGRLRTLEVLQVGMWQSDVTDGRQLVPLARLPRLRSLSGLCHDRDEATEGLSRFPALEHAGLNRGTDAGVRNLARLRTLRSLYLRSPAVTDVGLAEVATLPRLERLSLEAGPNAADAGLDALAAAPQLVSFDVQPEGAERPAYTEAGLRRFVAARGPRLEEFGAYGVEVGDDFVTHLAANAPNLRRLALGRCSGVTDRSVPALLTLTRLRSLDLISTSMGPAVRPQLESLVRGGRLNIITR